MCGTFRIHLVLVLFFYYFSDVRSGRVKRVIGGMEVACGTQVRVASLRNATNLQHLCGATLLCPHYALTAAHCVSRPVAEYFLQLNNYCNEAIKAAILEIIVHEQHDPDTRAHDIALISISLPIDDTAWLNDSVLPISGFGLSGECTMYGYGYRDLQVQESSDKLWSGQMKVVSLDTCTEILGPYIAPQPDWGMMCAMGDGVDSCQGDSGGPLICHGLVEAISSYGMSCGVQGRPGVYTSVASHLHWIRDIIDCH